jgi:hypothetical protein
MSDNKTITVRIDSSRPIFIEADADSFGQIFAGVSDEEQVGIFRSMVEHMKPHQMQWDYIAIALEKDENRDVYNDLSVIFPSAHEFLGQIATKDAEIKRLREALERLDKWFDTWPEILAAMDPDALADHNRQRKIISDALSPIPDPAGGMPVEVK